MPKTRFDLREWLLKGHKEDAKAYPWDAAASYLLDVYHTRELAPFAAFSGAWDIGNYERPKTQGVGYVVLFEDEFWLVQSRATVQALVFEAHKLATVNVMDSTARGNWRGSNLLLNREWIWLSLYPVPHGGREAARAFRRYL